MKKKVFITGASSGIGEFLAYAYAKKGYFIGLAARREDKLVQIASKCFELGGEAKCYTLDVTNSESCKKDIEDFISLPGEIDTIYANAGIGAPDQLSTGDSSYMNKILLTNILGVTNIVLPFIPYLKTNKRGKVAVISSIASFRGLAHHSAYSGSKAAVRNFCQGWNNALYKYNISFSAICPGFVSSEMTDNQNNPQPFKISTSLAVDKIIRAVENRRKVFIFPWQAKMFIIPVMKWAPDWLTRLLRI